jgi:hypothetical protein
MTGGIKVLEFSDVRFAKCCRLMFSTFRLHLRERVRSIGLILLRRFTGQIHLHTITRALQLRSARKCGS